jgi:hypothetical protein
MPANAPELRLRITLRRPPVGVAFALQRCRAGAAETVDRQIADGSSDLAFECGVRAADAIRA